MPGKIDFEGELLLTAMEGKGEGEEERDPPPRPEEAVKVGEELPERVERLGPEGLAVAQPVDDGVVAGEAEGVRGGEVGKGVCVREKFSDLVLTADREKEGRLDKVGAEVMEEDGESKEVAEAAVLRVPWVVGVGFTEELPPPEPLGTPDFDAGEDRVGIQTEVALTVTQRE